MLNVTKVYKSAILWDGNNSDSLFYLRLPKCLSYVVTLEACLHMSGIEWIATLEGLLVEKQQQQHETCIMHETCENLSTLKGPKGYPSPNASCQSLAWPTHKAIEADRTA